MYFDTYSDTLTGRQLVVGGGGDRGGGLFFHFFLIKKSALILGQKDLIVLIFWLNFSFKITL